MKKLRTILFVLAFAVVAVPAAIVGITGNGFGAPTARIMVSLSIVLLLGATFVGINKNNKAEFYTKVGAGIGLLTVLLSLWF